MPEWTGKTRGGVAGYKSFVFILKYFGISTAYFVLKFVVIYFLIFATKPVKSSLYFFNKRLKYSYSKSIWYVLRTFNKLGQVLIDKVAFLSGLNKRYTFNFDGEENLRQMAESTGGVLIGVHAGSWEIAGHLLRRLKTKINIVMFADEHEKIQNLLSNMYQDNRVNFIVVGNDDYSYLFDISLALKNKELVAIHGDRYLPGTKTLSIELFNKIARFPAGPFLLPIKFNVPVSFVTALKEKSKHYHFYATAPKKFRTPKNTSDRNIIALAMLEDYRNNIENILSKYPDQWFNFYDFWDSNN